MVVEPANGKKVLSGHLTILTRLNPLYALLEGSVKYSTGPVEPPTRLRPSEVIAWSKWVETLPVPLSVPAQFEGSTATPAGLIHRLAKNF